MSPLAQSPILLWGRTSRLRDALAAELAAMRALVVEGETPDALIEGLASFSRAPSTVILPETSIEPDRFETELAELRIRAATTRLVPITYGRMPDGERRMALRRAGVHLALFAPFGGHALRFQVNRALSRHATRAPRGDLRVPKEWRTRTFASGREKRVRCYSLSTGGAYLVTPRPWVVGSDLALELPLGQEPLRVAGRVVYTKGSADAARPLLPEGMAIAFRPLAQPVHDAIRADVSRSRFGLEV
ncbi:MAG: PilZ domain-containing protein [Deltaproteobacteria bacterium]|jgi:hypothetical protein|nr:PilZ domain-containing protein [Deltaproteobacteria bacterium]MBW2499315.1 PilZ domain-containing protein [Deltaproteobacteria bacterium]